MVVHGSEWYSAIARLGKTLSHGQNLVYGPIKGDGHQSVNWLIGENDIYDIYI